MSKRVKSDVRKSQLRSDLLVLMPAVADKLKYYEWKLKKVCAENGIDFQDDFRAVYCRDIGDKFYINSNIFMLIFLCDASALSGWVKRGIPCNFVGHHRYFNIEECRAWFRGEI